MSLALLSLLPSNPLTAMALATALLLEVPTTFKPAFPWAFTAVYVVGFIAAVSIGSLAWYNSKRPAGWEGRDRPDYLPDLQGNANEGGAASADSAGAEDRPAE